MSTLGKVPILGKVWQHGFYDFNIYTEKKFYEKLNYTHWNTARAGLVQDPKDYKWSSYNFLEFGEGHLTIERIEF
ncbi:MAG: hypothetical protein COX43_03995 [Parcubacteria group bacterium CG23_combo_of_CG06-09_8_20_14_all_35_9]|nr:MAG: hypothetical protein COX43_03995 [Parcubacteria group bacterium CG23_combo_of_CG06-09_8_20_14_all_35_9]